MSPVPQHAGLEIWALDGVPKVAADDDLAELIARGLTASGRELH
ncbi:MAG: hypothetical protein QOE40_1471, partial [Actinomycetota bacterium]|nr:hypothetical protein [Actinomycetota bacterium]